MFGACPELSVECRRRSESAALNDQANLLLWFGLGILALAAILSWRLAVSALRPLPTLIADLDDLVETA